MKMLGNTNFEQNFVYEKTQKTNNNFFFPKFGDGSNLQLLFVICVVLVRHRYNIYSTLKFLLNISKYNQDISFNNSVFPW